MRFLLPKSFLFFFLLSLFTTSIAEPTRYAGVGLSVDYVNPHGKVYIENILAEKLNTRSGPEYSPQLFGGIKTTNFIKDLTLRFQGGVDLHTVHLNHNNGVTQDIIDFHYTFNLGVQALKTLSNQVDGYVGLKVLSTRVHASASLIGDDGDVTLGKTRKFIFGLSPNVGLIYRVSDQLFFQLEGHVSFYQPYYYSAMLNDVHFKSKVRPTWMGVSLGIGWCF